VLDYANNIKYHAPDGDIFNPNIKNNTLKDDAERTPIYCPKCGTENMVVLRDGFDEETVNKNGYFQYLDNPPDPSVPVHYGRRCVGVDHKLNRCDHFWFSKQCPACDHHNDIAARFCESCKHELVDPNEKLTLEFNKFKGNPENLQTDLIEDFSHAHHVSAKGNECHKLTIYTPWRSFTVWVPIDAKNPMQQANLKAVEMIMDGTAKTVTYQKSNDFYRIIAINRKPDEVPTVA
jgi:DNA repair protein RadD